MQINSFPPSYKADLDIQTNKQIETATNESNSRIKSLNEKKYHFSRLTKGKGLFDLIWSGAEIGFFVNCVPTFIISGSGYYHEDFVSAVFTSLFTCIVISVIISIHVDKKRVMKNKQQEICIIDKIATEEGNLKKTIEKIKTNALDSQKKYVEQFEKQAQDMSVQFAESELAKEVIEWMTKGFCEIIDSADRQNYVEQILESFTFHVYVDRITCNLGTYDFKIHRCRNLSDAIEQTALARALVSAIQLNIVMKYPKDISETDITINIDYSYTEVYPVTTITYIAPNGNYETVRGW